LWIKWRAKRRYLWKEEFEASIAELSAKAALKRAADTRNLVARMTKEADDIEARIKEATAMEENGFWMCENGHENADADIETLDAHTPSYAVPKPDEIQVTPRVCKDCGAPAKLIKRDTMTGQEKYESDKQRKEVESNPRQQARRDCGPGMGNRESVEHGNGLHETSEPRAGVRGPASQTLTMKNIVDTSMKVAIRHQPGSMLTEVYFYAHQGARINFFTFETKNGKMSRGILQSQDAFWSDMSAASGITGNPDNSEDAIRMAEYAVENGYLNRWTTHRNIVMRLEPSGRELSLNAPGLSEALAPVTRTAATMSNRDDLYAGDGLPKNDHERKPTQDDTVRTKVMSGILLRILADLIHCMIKLIRKHPGSPPASSRLPIHRRLSLFQRSRVDSQGLAAHCSSWSRRRLRAALQEISSTVPSSICFSRSSISLFQASVAPSSTVASRLSIRESIRAERASRGKARASRSSSAGWLSMNRFYRARRLWAGQGSGKGSPPMNAFVFHKRIRAGSHSQTRSLVGFNQAASDSEDRPIHSQTGAPPEAPA
jgi:hypothetical protein